MGRKPKCTVEEKISAVEDYLNGIRSVSQIMVDLSIKSTRTIRDWILAYQNGGIEAIFPVTANHSYSKEFKTEMVQKARKIKVFRAFLIPKRVTKVCPHLTKREPFSPNF